MKEREVNDELTLKTLRDEGTKVSIPSRFQEHKPNNLLIQILFFMLKCFTNLILSYTSIRVTVTSEFKNSMGGHVYSFAPIITMFPYMNSNLTIIQNCTNSKFNRYTMMDVTKEQVYRTYFTFSIPQFKLTVRVS